MHFFDNSDGREGVPPGSAKLPGGCRILVLDDDTHIALTLELIFLARGYKVKVAFSAEQAIEIIADWQPDVAVVDVMLVGMNGIEFGTALKNIYPECQVVLCSGHPGSAKLLEAARAEGHNFQIMAKPIHPAQILEIIAGLQPGTTGEA